ncbi:alpha-2-macroglobulin-like protein 1 [Penaeus japonicus]|uniref:alpha-2-macroglobulin-like protein 1 n=1 Tax=Penaeus japonicus TaxID=27405 RepID=UPI001C70E5C2|nr:alpha-2-macroglobulin-like protein 1 [Penaeus japonicus]
MLGGVLLALGALAFCSGSYVITTPRRWIPGDKNQLCINIQADQTTGGALSISMTTPQSRPHQKDTNVTILPRETLSIAAGQSHHCHDIRLPAGNYYRGYLTLSGRLNGASVEETVEVALRNNRNKTFIQTDKYLYQPGQEVKFRLLTVYGWKSLVSREKVSTGREEERETE